MAKKLQNFPLGEVPAGSDFWLTRAVQENAARADRFATSAHTRASLRRKIELEALVNYGLSYSVPWKIRDLSLSGAFLEMDAADLEEGGMVEFVLRFAYKERRVEHRLPAKVARITPEGVALEFKKYNNEVYTDLVNLIYAN